MHNRVYAWTPTHTDTKMVCHCIYGMRIWARLSDCHLFTQQSMAGLKIAPVNCCAVYPNECETYKNRVQLWFKITEFSYFPSLKSKQWNVVPEIDQSHLTWNYDEFFLSNLFKTFQRILKRFKHSNWQSESVCSTVCLN